MIRTDAGPRILAIAAVVMLSACGDSGPAPVDNHTASQTVRSEPSPPVGENGTPAAFTQCVACHQVNKPEHSGIGPHLVGVFGASAGSRGDYRYSDALKQSKIVWNEQTLSDYIESPQRAVSGTKMAFGGVSNSEDRQEIIEYLAKLK